MGPCSLITFSINILSLCFRFLLTRFALGDALSLLLEAGGLSSWFIMLCSLQPVRLCRTSCSLIFRDRLRHISHNAFTVFLLQSLILFSFFFILLEGNPSWYPPPAEFCTHYKWAAFSWPRRSSAYHPIRLSHLQGLFCLCQKAVSLFPARNSNTLWSRSDTLLLNYRVLRINRNYWNQCFWLIFRE